MKVLTNTQTPKIGDILGRELDIAEDIVIAVAYFLPNQTIINKLREISNRRIIVSGEFHINNPDKLNQLNERGIVRYIKPEQNRLHAKVILGRRNDSTRFALIGSANLTNNGLFSNQEVSLLFDSVDSEDNTTIEMLSDWIEHLWKNSLAFNYQDAKSIFDNAKGKWNTRNRTAENGTDETNYWIIKTTEGANGKSYWDQFLSDSVIAIGWKELDIDPSSISMAELTRILQRIYHYSYFQSQIAAYTIESFVSKITIGDIVVICKGYPANSGKMVFLYGIARVNGAFNIRLGHNKWKFVRNVEIQPVEEYLPKSIFVNSLKKKSLMKTIHRIHTNEFTRFSNLLHNEYGISIVI